MSAETPEPNEEERITAALMGQLSPEETAQLEARIAADPELQALREKLRRAANLLREATASMPAAEGGAPTQPARLSAEKRKQLLRHLRGVELSAAEQKVLAPELPANDKPRRADWGWALQLGVAAALMALIGGGLLLSRPSMTASLGGSHRGRAEAAAAAPARAGGKHLYAYYDGDKKGGDSEERTKALPVPMLRTALRPDTHGGRSSGSGSGGGGADGGFAADGKAEIYLGSAASATQDKLHLNTASEGTHWDTRMAESSKGGTVADDFNFENSSEWDPRTGGRENLALGEVSASTDARRLDSDADWRMHKELAQNALRFGVTTTTPADPAAPASQVAPTFKAPGTTDLYAKLDGPETHEFGRVMVDRLESAPGASPESGSPIRGLTTSGAGTLTLNGSNSYSGGTLVSGGLLMLPNGGTTPQTQPVAGDRNIDISGPTSGSPGASGQPREGLDVPGLVAGPAKQKEESGPHGAATEGWKSRPGVVEQKHDDAIAWAEKGQKSALHEEDKERERLAATHGRAGEKDRLELGVDAPTGATTSKTNATEYSSDDSTVAWQSQPGMIRTYGNGEAPAPDAGKLAEQSMESRERTSGFYRLYPDSTATPEKSTKFYEADGVSRAAPEDAEAEKSKLHLQNGLEPRTPSLSPAVTINGGTLHFSGTIRSAGNEDDLPLPDVQLANENRKSLRLNVPAESGEDLKTRSPQKGAAEISDMNGNPAAPAKPARPGPAATPAPRNERAKDAGEISRSPKAPPPPENALTKWEKAVDQTDVAQKNPEPPAPRIAPDPLIPQPEVSTAVNAFSTFSLNVTDVAFKLAAASLERGTLPEAGNLRSEEFINAFDYGDPEAAPGNPLAFATERARYPFAQNRDILRFSVKTAAAGRAAGQPLNLVLLLDNSGSMERADRVRIVKEALRVLTAQFHDGDKLSLITFARTPRLWADGVVGREAAEKATARVTEITPQGGTNLEAALDLGYQTAAKHFVPNGSNRVVLLTDGAANLGDVDPAALQKKVEAHRLEGIALDSFGVGWEGYNDDLLEQLTRHGDGRYGFINTPDEATTGFAAQLAGALHVAAADVKVQVEFNPKRVTSYRQIGYAKHQLTKEQFRDNTVDAAELGAAEAGNALYTVEVNPAGSGDLGTVRVRFKVPGTGEYREHAWPVPYTGHAMPLEQASPALRLATTASAFSEMLAGSPFAAEVTSDRLLELLNGVPAKYQADPRPKKLEWMIRTAKSLTGR